VALGLLLSGRQRMLAFALLAICWSLANFHARIADRLDRELAGQTMTGEGEVSSLPRVFDDHVEFLFRPGAAARAAGLPSRMLVKWYEEWPELFPGEQWRLTLKLQPPWGRVNFTGPDRERWYFAMGIGATGSVRNGERLEHKPGYLDRVQAWRERIRNSITDNLPDPVMRGIVQALAIADRSAMAERDRRLLILTGTSHLLAISGLHIGLAAAGGMLLARMILWFMPLLHLGRLALVATLMTGLVSALLYAMLAGLGVSTLRAVLMFGVLVLAGFSARSVHPLMGFSLALAAVLLVDPFSPLGAGFWFSFLAVAGLLAAFQPRAGRPGLVGGMLRAQAAVILVLLPVSAAWFGGFSVVGYVANLVAIPWVSVLVVPFVLSGVACLGLSVQLASLLWAAAGQSAVCLLALLEWGAFFQQSLTSLAPLPLLQLALALVGAFIITLPRGLRFRRFGIFMLLPLFVPPGPGAAEEDMHIDVLDAGQGTAVLVRAAGQTLLYDSGPGDGAGINLVDSVITPALSRSGAALPTRTVISHGDKDHAGGLGGLIERYPGSLFRGNLPPSDAELDRCEQAQEWRWGTAAFKVLHPTAALPYLGNDSSCVISIRSSASGVLLAGDVSSAVEERLIDYGVGRHDVLLVPHHGSLTSSGRRFIKEVGPSVAVVTARLGNRFGFPRPEIAQRYHENGAAFWSSGECGALQLVLRANGEIEAESARKRRKRIWRWPAGTNCP
jgi:competence protein ComEC